MGGIIIANYAASSGDDCPLDAVISVGGTIDAVRNHGFYESVALWQQVMCGRLKQTIIAPSIRHIVAHGISVDTVSACTSLEDLDREVIAKYFGYNDLIDYHEDMSAGRRGKLQKLARPLLFLNACNDPIASSQCFADYIRNVESMNENLFVIMTAGGGHVGWPVGLFPTIKQFHFMSNSALEFCENVFKVKDRLKKGNNVI